MMPPTASAWARRGGGQQAAEPAEQVLAVDEHGDRQDGHDGDAGDAADERAGDLGDALVGELLGQLADPLLDPVADLVVPEPAADERQRPRAGRRSSGSWSENLRASADGPRAEHDDEQGGEAEDGERDDGDGEPAAHVEAPLERSTSGSSARATSTPMPMRVSIVVVLRNSAIRASAPSTANVR